MKILLNDILQYSDAPEPLKSPMLSERTSINETIINLDKNRQINAIGIGNTDGTSFDIIFNDAANTTFTFRFIGNGLYCMDSIISASKIRINTNATYVGRIGAGLGIHIPTSIAKEPGFVSTAEPRITLSGQVINGLGGYNYRILSLDSRYKIDEVAMNEIQEGYNTIGAGFPFFIDLTDESYKLPFSKFYATEIDQKKMSFEGGIRKYLYSRRWYFEEKF